MSIEVLLDLAFPIEDMFPEADELDPDKSKLKQSVFYIYKVTDAVGSAHHSTTFTDFYHSDSHCAASTFSGFTGRNVSDTINAATVITRPFTVSSVIP